ncbi:VENN motif pre-toxin domain-containing protein [Enterobacter asburiae]|nr:MULTISPECIES: VENN motif pre-toxin domain-containing protein [Enterobacter]MCS5454595.1 VENN motif pre-toxin domain-containing protein [Enterobacter asburiae]
MYPGKAVSDLSEELKQTVSTLATISAGMAGGLAGRMRRNRMHLARMTSVKVLRIRPSRQHPGLNMLRTIIFHRNRYRPD